MSAGEGSEVQLVTRTVSYSYGNAQWPDLLTAYDGHSISYDAGGNPTAWYDGAVMTWAKGRQLASISATNDHAALSFSYNADGLRLTKTAGTTTHRYTWQGNTLIAESYGNTELEFFYDESGRPYALLVRAIDENSSTEARYFYVTNLQGDVVMLLDASGNAVAEYSYNAWGEVLDASGIMAEINPIRYRGYYYDAETGLYYLQSRYYDPAIGRFINSDVLASTGQGILGCNMFAYCGNDPVLGIDESGDYPIWPVLFEDDDPGFIHRAVQNHIVYHHPGIGKEKAIYYADGTLCGRADLYASDGSIWEIKTTRTGAAAAELRLCQYCGNGQTLGRNGPTTMRGESGFFPGYFCGSFALTCGEDSYTVVYYTPQPGVVLYYAKKNEREEREPYAIYVPRRERSASRKSVIGNVTDFKPAATAAIGLGALSAIAYVGGKGGYCFDTFTAFG